jgi:hypothetical protein
MRMKKRKRKINLISIFQFSGSIGLFSSSTKIKTRITTRIRITTRNPDFNMGNEIQIFNYKKLVKIKSY